MSTREWTDKQRYSIEARGGSVLVSAAAGSGKTAVLVERVIRRITDQTAPVDIDRLLIVTFTRAAAAEMRQRLSAALAHKMAQEPDNPLYQRQQLLLPQANISTIHGFCARLLRQYSACAGLPPQFRVAEDTQAGLLAAQALDEVLEESYTQQDHGFLMLATQLGGRRDDNGLRDAVQQAYTFMQAQPFPMRWLEEKTDAYTTVCPLEETAWAQPLWKEISFTLEGCVGLMDRAVTVSQMDGLESYHDVLILERMQIEQLMQRIQTGTYDQRLNCLSEFGFGRLPPVRSKDAAVDECKQVVKELRATVKKKIAKLTDLFCGSEGECRDDLAAMAPMVEALGTLVRRYAERYEQVKRRKKILDYNDLEHACLRLLLDEETGARTALAVELSARYDEIMVDEYQDTNAAQDALFTALSRDKSNLFMVGDVKQSIYGFRQAMPSIFTDRRDSYVGYDPDNPQYPATITLENNFRSRDTVTDSVNFLFRQLMQKRLGGVEYDEREALVCSAKYPSTSDCDTEWLIVDKACADVPVPGDEVLEARVIARRIRGMMQTMRVSDGDGTRALAYGDICILLRSRTKAGVYVKELTRLGIPVGADGGGSFFAAPEVQTALSLLRVIDNPLREVELTAVMMSPLYGFTADDCARIRMGGEGRVPLYTAIEQYAVANGDLLALRCVQLQRDLRRYRTLAVSLPADRFIERLYRDTDLPAVFSARNDGRQRVENLHQLDRVARGFEQDGFRGLSAFVRYVDRLQEQGKDLPTGSTASSDGVRLMTVHGSKGLEFPVVFLARLSGQMNTEDSKQKLLFHHTVGIGMRRLNEVQQTKHRTLPFVGVLSAHRQDDRAEELRVWYVALTRAKEKLCMVMTVDDLRRRAAKLEMTLSAERAIPPDALLHAVSPADWFLTAALRHPSFSFLRSDGEMTHSLVSERDWTVRVFNPSELTDNETVTRSADVLPNEELVKLLRARAEYRYKFEALCGVPAKLAASQLSHESMSRQYVAASRPAFLQKEGLTAAQKGTALHTFMQFADYDRAAENLSAEIELLTCAGFLSEQQAQVLDLKRIQLFLQSSLYARMRVSEDCRREFHFTVHVPADTVSQKSIGFENEQVVVQGIADCVFREGDGIVLVDYKTDRVNTPDELIERYRSQMQFYKRALEPIFGLPVTEVVLYSFHFGKAITIK